jgi:8-oxo-dGTP diphosphatase
MKEDLFFLGVKAIIKNGKGEILVLRKNKAEIKGHDKIEKWDIPGGRLKRGDTPETTILREIKEETGISSVTSIEPFGITISNLRIILNKDEDAGLIFYTFLCQAKKTDKINISSEHILAKWVEPKEASILLLDMFPPEFSKKIASLQGELLE